MDFLTSVALICLCALLLGSICAKLKLPPLIGMLISGIVLGPFVLDLIAPSILNLSADLRQLALVIILTRAGLNLDLKGLRKNGLTAVLLCFLPALFEIVAYLILGKFILGMSLTDSAILGAVMAAVSPAVIVPRMLKLKEQNYGTDKAIPDMIMAGASADDVFVIVIFTALTTGANSGLTANVLWQIPLSIISGIAVGIAVGFVLVAFFKKIHIRDTIKVLIILSISFLFIALEDAVQKYFPLSGLIAVISMNTLIYAMHKTCAKRLSKKFDKLWVAGELMLFVLVGAQVNLEYALQNALPIIAVMFIALAVRMVGVLVCVLPAKLNAREKLFAMIAYCPKATVQAGIGAIPLSLGMACGQTVLTASVLAILITAPLGAFAIDLTYKKLLNNCSTAPDGSQ